VTLAETLLQYTTPCPRCCNIQRGPIVASTDKQTHLWGCTCAPPFAKARCGDQPNSSSCGGATHRNPDSSSAFEHCHTPSVSSLSRPMLHMTLACMIGTAQRWSCATRVCLMLLGFAHTWCAGGCWLPTEMDRCLLQLACLVGALGCCHACFEHAGRCVHMVHRLG
jgi:hypothetical protein